MSPDEDIRVSEKYSEASGIISQRPCWLWSVVLYGAAANANNIKLYDGQDTSGSLELHIGAAQYTTTSVVYFKPKWFSKGIYMEEVAGTCSVAFQYSEAQ
jgi:hypothetical protein